MSTELTTTSANGLQISISEQLQQRNATSMSVFLDGKANESQIKHAVQKLKICFPKVSDAFYAVLVERFISSGISANRLQYAINFCIDNMHYHNLTIADIMGIDIRIKKMTAQDVYKTYGRFPAKEVVKVKCATPYYIDANDCYNYGLDKIFDIVTYKY